MRPAWSVQEFEWETGCASESNATAVCDSPCGTVGEPVRDLDDVPPIRNRRYLQYIRQLEMHAAVLGVFVQHGAEDLARGRQVLLEERRFFLLQALGAFAPGSQRGMEGQVTQQVEGVRLRLAGHVGESFHVDTLFQKAIDDFRPAFGVQPVPAKFGCVRIQGAHPVGGVVGELAAGELSALRVELIDQVLHDLDLAVVDIVLPGQALGVIVEPARWQSRVRARETRNLERSLTRNPIPHRGHRDVLQADAPPKARWATPNRMGAQLS